MTRTKNQIIIRSPPSSSTHMRRQRLLSTDRTSTGSQRFAAAAGETTAECAAICCCCPCGIVKLLVLAVVKVPAGICRKALRTHRRRKMISISSSSSSSSMSLSSSDSGKIGDGRMRRCCGGWEREFHLHPVAAAAFGAVEEMDDEVEEVFVVGREVAKELMEIEKEMWDRFYSAGFWRSPSQREPASAAAFAAVEFVAQR